VIKADKIEKRELQLLVNYLSRDEEINLKNLTLITAEILYDVRG